jgi:hypothetical protein
MARAWERDDVVFAMANRADGRGEFRLGYGFEVGSGAPRPLFRCIRETKEWGAIEELQRDVPCYMSHQAIVPLEKPIRQQSRPAFRGRREG